MKCRNSDIQQKQIWRLYLIESTRNYHEILCPKNYCTSDNPDVWQPCNKPLRNFQKIQISRHVLLRLVVASRSTFKIGQSFEEQRAVGSPRQARGDSLENGPSNVGQVVQSLCSTFVRALPGLSLQEVPRKPLQNVRKDLRRNHEVGSPQLPRKSPKATCVPSDLQR